MGLGGEPTFVGSARTSGGWRAFAECSKEHEAKLVIAVQRE